MNILGIIPARGGSKTVPGKNIKILEGKPLLQYTVEVAKASKHISKVILSSDDDAIIQVANQLNLEVPFKRPSDLAQDNSPTLPVIQHALKFYKNQGVQFDAVCLLQVTSPFKTAKFIDNAIEKFMESNADALVSVKKVPDEYNPHWTFKVDEYDCLELSTGEKSIISRRQDLPVSYHRDGIIYLTKTDVLLNQNSLYGNTLAYIESPPDFNVNIDTMEDWEKAVAIAKKLNL
ncbi:MAG: acylneuraminate cytidylyltransferase family protein [Algibacter sp.]|uniref:acylneuraminate cytidylyltransferase family protein n=1 Tax=Algibacter sp. TaxID=1872428 RepID=UPI00260D8CFB|nr:acylneuraminate cytidylyltransferase family protein [Algibacter sp.]MDG1729354.1 acylneuraminate cytidylyltransferase family protein [Algibacter sp.]MDG2177325.1 acylneuraminate cytidylyltransferase family protein [Algibacter sp.]